MLTVPSATISGVTLASNRIPNSITQDGPVLICSLSSGPGVLIPLLTLPRSSLINYQLVKNYIISKVLPIYPTAHC